MNKKDVEAYQKSYEEIDILLKRYPHLRHVVVGELKTKSGKELFKKLNEHSKNLQTKQDEIIKKHNSLSAKYDELEHLKANMNNYLGKNTTEKKKSVFIEIRLIGIGVKVKRNLKKGKRSQKKLRYNCMVGVILELYQLILFFRVRLKRIYLFKKNIL